MSDHQNRKNVLEIAALAKLELEPSELERINAEFAKILDYFGQLTRLNTEAVAPIFHPTLERATPLRHDQAQDFLTQEEATENAPEAEDGQFKVPKVIE